MSAPPPYTVPSLAEIRSLPWNGYRVASTFSGGGGSSLGYRMAGFRVVWANEFVESAQESYRANASPDTILDGRDIREVTTESILEATGLAKGELDLFDGSPPCASFSLSGKREAGWGTVKKYSDREQRSDDLFFEFARILEGLQPKTFVAENVAGLVRGTAKGYFIEIFERLVSAGYRVACRVLDAQWLGVPQARQRVIFVGVRNDLGLDPVHPTPFPFRYSVADVLPSIWDPTPIPEVDISRFAIGREWARISPGDQSARYFNLVKVDPHKPCPTIAATGGVLGAASIAHPYSPRKFTLDELRVLASFPVDFELVGTYQQRYERIGRSVPPLMMRAIASTVRDEILGKITR